MGRQSRGTSSVNLTMTSSPTSSVDATSSKNVLRRSNIQTKRRALASPSCRYWPPARAALMLARMCSLLSLAVAASFAALSLLSLAVAAFAALASFLNGMPILLRHFFQQNRPAAGEEHLLHFTACTTCARTRNFAGCAA